MLSYLLYLLASFLEIFQNSKSNITAIQISPKVRCSPIPFIVPNFPPTSPYSPNNCSIIEFGWYYDIPTKECQTVTIPCFMNKTINFFDTKDECEQTCQSILH